MRKEVANNERSAGGRGSAASMRILVSSPIMEVGGAERIVVQIVKGLVERGNQVGLMASRGSLDADLADVPHDRYILPLPSRSAVGVARVLVAMRSAVTTFKPDVIHAQNVLHAALAGAAGRVASRPRPPVLATFHGLNPGELRIASKLFRAADAVACVPEDLRNVLVSAGFPASRAHLIRNAVDAAVPLTRERSAALDAELKLGAVAGGQRPPVVAIVGRLAPEKDHDRFLRAAARVAGSCAQTCRRWRASWVSRTRSSSRSPAMMRATSSPRQTYSCSRRSGRACPSLLSKLWHAAHPLYRPRRQA
jgi:glycosyltransferase involved in cell wall biosynthesis